MIKRTLKQVHEMAEGLNDISRFQSKGINGVTIDSRTVKEGCCSFRLRERRLTAMSMSSRL